MVNGVTIRGKQTGKVVTRAVIISTKLPSSSDTPSDVYSELPMTQKASKDFRSFQSSGVCESRGSRPGLPVPDSPYGLRGREATLN